jgi:acyl-CoA synthetase (AMP-forming)/AMP-acid ligase II
LSGNTLKDHWFQTGLSWHCADVELILNFNAAAGDVATIDPDGYMQITDRSKDVIKSGGEWISSIDLENEAVAHPSVRAVWFILLVGLLIVSSRAYRSWRPPSLDCGTRSGRSDRC